VILHVPPRPDDDAELATFYDACTVELYMYVRGLVLAGRLRAKTLRAIAARLVGLEPPAVVEYLPAPTVAVGDRHDLEAVTGPLAAHAPPAARASMITAGRLAA
jgi:hypothetical protein